MILDLFYIYIYIYIKVEHQSEGIFIYKHFDKRDLFPFSIVRMSHIKSSFSQHIFLFSNQRRVFMKCLFNSMPQGFYT